jgi:hypothetical protein
MQHAYHGRSTDKKAQNQAYSQAEFDHAHEVTKHHRMRQDDMAEHRPVEANCRLMDVSLQIVRESGTSEFASENFVLSEYDEENSRADAREQQSFGKHFVGRLSQSFSWRILPGRPRGARLVELTRQRVDTRLQHVADG